MLKTFSSQSARALLAALISTVVVVAPLPFSIGTASAVVAVPPAPTVVAGPESVTATVAAPTSGDLPAWYRVYANPSSKNCDITGASGSCTITGLTAGTAHTFKVIAFDVLLGGATTPTGTALSPASVAVTPLGAAPAFDTNGIVTSTNGLSIERLINSAGNPSGGALGGTKPDVTSFTVLADGQRLAVASVQYGPACQAACYIMDLTLASKIENGSVVTVSYAAPTPDLATTNAAIQSPTGADAASFGPLSVTNRVPAPTAPNAPGIPTVVAGEESATITVTAPTGGVVPTSYEVTASPGGKKCTVNGASGSCTVTGLTAGTAYTFTTVAKTSTGSSSASTASTSITVLATNTVPAGYTPSWDKEPLTDSETDANTVGFFPAVSPGVIIITDEMGFTLDKKNGIKPKIRMKNYAGKIKMSISASYKVGAKTVKYKCAFAPFGTAKKMKTAKWRWYTPKKACILPAPLVAAVRANTATLSASGKWTRQWLTTSKKARPDKTKIKARTLKYTMKAKPAAVK